ncbi:MAG: hypothetical protein J1E39_09555 [Eubacterium sp.]|nr:hypothetical protein [Eubacterium sp.]
MKNSCLWINGVKVSDVKGITDNFNISDVRGYFLGGSLIPWLESRGEYDKAYALRGIPTNVNPDKALYDIFNNVYEQPVYHQGVSPVPTNTVMSSGGSYNLPSSLTGSSFQAGSFTTNSFSANSFTANSFTTGSYRFEIGSYRVSSGTYQYEFEFELGSYVGGSFAQYLTSFNLGSFNFGSYMSGSFNWESFVPSSFTLGSFTYDDFIINGQFHPAAPILKSLSSEPLNRFGYGIHII